MAQDDPPHGRRTELTFEQLVQQTPFRIELMNTRPVDSGDAIVAISKPMKNEEAEALLTPAYL